MYNVDCSYNVHSGYLTQADTLDAVLIKAAWARDYYEALYPGTVRIKIEILCEVCHGKGVVIKGRKNARILAFKDCPHCKGRGAFPIPTTA